eukprot:TRINITY_DN863_c0_g1_i2.p1 TRINITY_DN863_c0_g1~~TRINITY_DN863_c0_g1_i2.p1  ORF type:complete len:330 (+),score=56.23 TRINITY_DN863_c0_g1_i2:160-1149(+)
MFSCDVCSRKMNSGSASDHLKGIPHAKKVARQRVAKIVFDKGKLNIDEIPTTYQEMYGQKLDHKKLKYQTLRRFLFGTDEISLVTTTDGIFAYCAVPRNVINQKKSISTDPETDEKKVGPPRNTIIQTEMTVKQTNLTKKDFANDTQLNEASESSKPNTDVTATASKNVPAKEKITFTKLSERHSLSEEESALKSQESLVARTKKEIIQVVAKHTIVYLHEMGPFYIETFRQPIVLKHLGFKKLKYLLKEIPELECVSDRGNPAYQLVEHTMNRVSAVYQKKFRKTRNVVAKKPGCGTLMKYRVVQTSVEKYLIQWYLKGMTNSRPIHP